MKKSDILKLLEKRFKYLPKSEVERTVEKILHFFTLKLSQGKRIEIRDFGTFTTKVRNARKGRNPLTGEEIDIKKKVFVHYNPGKNLKKKLNER